MPLKIEDPKTEQLAAEVAALTGESKTAAIHSALAEKRERLSRGVTYRDRRQRLLRLLEEQIWPAIPRSILGRRISKRKNERALGYGPDGV